MSEGIGKMWKSSALNMCSTLEGFRHWLMQVWPETLEQHCNNILPNFRLWAGKTDHVVLGGDNVPERAPSKNHFGQKVELVWSVSISSKEMTWCRETGGETYHRWGGGSKSVVAEFSTPHCRALERHPSNLLLKKRQHAYLLIAKFGSQSLLTRFSVHFPHQGQIY